jgi:1,5-anhydro-D-fructose reductase (1,5-anhydro-D-mannitol-forming)
VAVEVAGMFDRDPDGRHVDMQDWILLRFANGTRASVHFSETNPHPQNDIALYGTRGRITAADLTRSRLDGVLTVRTAAGEQVTEYPNPGAHRLSVAAFTRAVLDGSEPDASGLDGLRSMVLCDAIARSVRERRVVEVDYAGASQGLLAAP